MVNKQHKYVLKAFIESRIPYEIKSNAPVVIRSDTPDLMMLDSIIGGYCTQILSRRSKINVLHKPIISPEDKLAFSSLINKASGERKEELVFYYRLAILAEYIILQYS